MAHLVVPYTHNSVDRHAAPATVCSNPKLGVNLLRRDDLAAEDMAHEKVVVHGLGDNFRDGSRSELDKAVVFRMSRLGGRS